MTRSSATYPHIRIGGDSFSQGIYATPIESAAYRPLLLAQIQAQNAGNGTTYSVGGVIGGKLVDIVTSVSNLAGFFFIESHPNLIILALGQNDLNSETTATFEAAVITAFDYLRDSVPLAAIMIVAIPQQISWINTTRGNLAVQFNEILRAQTAAYNFVYASSWDRALSERGIATPADVPDYATVGDYYHPNNFGHAELADALWRDLGPLLAGAIRRIASSRAAASTRAAASSRAAA